MQAPPSMLRRRGGVGPGRTHAAPVIYLALLADRAARLDGVLNRVARSSGRPAVSTSVHGLLRVDDPLMDTTGAVGGGDEHDGQPCLHQCSPRRDVPSYGAPRRSQRGTSLSPLTF